jgi:hypothetical protein
VQLASLTFAPVQYNPVTGTIRVYTYMVAEVTFAGADATKTNELKARTYSQYFKSAYSKVLNYQPTDAPSDTISKFPVKYVIVSDPMFEQALQPFIKWKTKRGFKVIEAYTNQPEVGNSFNSIKAYLQNLYTSATATDPAPTFVLLVGDVAQVPAYNCGDHVTDLYYCEYTGDYLPEVYYGRFSANNVAELMPQINKTLQYEQYLMPDPSYLNEVVMVAGADASHQLTWGNGQINYGTTYYFNEAHNLLSHTYLQPEPSGGNYSQNIQNDISNGVSYANYTAHGSPDGWADPSFSISDIADLTNADKYCLMVGNCCQTNTYNQNTFGEALLRAENKGALGYIGASDYSYWDEDYWWGVGNGQVVSNPTYETTGLGAYDRTFHDHGEPVSDWYSTMDQMIFAGNLAVEESNSSMKQYYWEIYCLMGDPSTMVYFSQPPAMTVDYMGMLPLGSPTFEVQAEPHAYVAISKNNVLHGVAETNENGLAVVPITPFNEPGFASIVVTKQNREPFIDSVMVASPNGPYLIMDEYTITDNAGNNNQLPEFSETLGVDLTFKNFGNTDAVNALSTLTTNDPYVTIPVSTYTWPLISSNGSANATQAFSIRANDYIPDQHIAKFTITTQADTSNFGSEFEVKFYAPELSIVAINIDDATGGNGNGQLDPGETVAFNFTISNTGHCNSAAIIAQMFVFGQYVTVLTSPQNIGTLAPGNTVNASLSLQVSPDAPAGSTFSVYLSAVAGLYNAVSGLTPAIGAQIEDYETGNFLKYNWRSKGNKPWKISSSVKYAGAFGATSGAITNNQFSQTFIEGQVLTNDSISFYRKVSSEEGYDFLKFYVDGIELGSWSGNKDWAKVSYAIPAGNHRFAWSYEKDDASMSGQDAAWLDNIVLPTMSITVSGPVALTTAAVPEVICPGGQSQLYVFAMGGSGSYSYNWSPANSLNNPDVFNPMATPDVTTTYTIEVQSLFASATDQVVVTVAENPATPVVTLSGNHLTSTPAAGYQWYNYDGPISGATAQSYTPEHTNYYYVVTSNAAGCLSEKSNEVYVGFTDINTPESANLSIYPNPVQASAKLMFNLRKAGWVNVSVYNATGIEIAVIANGYYSAGNHELSFSTQNLAAGVYYCKVNFDNQSSSYKLVKTK